MNIVQCILISCLLFHHQVRHNAYKFSDGHISFSCPVIMKATNKEYVPNNSTYPTIPANVSVDFDFGNNRMTLSYVMFDKANKAIQERNVGNLPDTTLHMYRKLYESQPKDNRSSFGCKKFSKNGIALTLIYFKYYWLKRPKKILILTSLFFSHKMILGEIHLQKVLKYGKDSINCNLLYTKYENIISHIAHTIVVH